MRLPTRRSWSELPRVLTAGLIAAWTLSALVLASPGAAQSSPEDIEQQLWRHRNLGKAFYENSATQYQAVGEFEKALALAPDSVREQVNLGLALIRAGQTEDGVARLEKAQQQDPSVPHTWFNLGIEYKRASRYDEAITQLEKMVELVPDEAISHYNLGVLRKLKGESDRALGHFERAAALDPNLAGPHFQLATTYRQAKNVEASKKHMQIFRGLKTRQAGAAVPEDLEWGWYSEIYDTLEAMAKPADFTRPELETVETGARLGEGPVFLQVIDLEGDGRLEVAFAGAGGIGWVDAEGKVEEMEGLGLEGGFRPLGLTAGDVDNDGLPDLALLSAEGESTEVRLLSSDGARLTPRSEPLARGRFSLSVWLDYDHDYDLDLLLFGAEPRLLRNDGEQGMTDQSAEFPFVAGPARAAVLLDVMADSQGSDLLVSYGDRGGVLYRDRLLGRYEAVDLRSIPAATRQLLATDLDHDGWTDVLALGDEARVLLNSTRESFRPLAPFEAAAPAALADPDLRGTLDLVAGDGVWRHRGNGRFARGNPLQLASKAMVAADLDADGRADVVRVDGGGTLVLERNRGRGESSHLRVALSGIKNLRRAPGAEIEVKAGSFYQKRLYDGTPLVFGLADRREIDTVRITWPNGLIQNETQVEAPVSVVYEEAQRLSGSCPMIFTWDGEHFRFITDVLGVAPLGASAGDGEYFPVDSDESVQIPGDALVEKDGALEIRITEELREVAYLDRIRLRAIDHPADQRIFINDKFIGPPFPEHRLFGVEKPIYPRTARDHRGRDVRELLLRKDARYPSGFERSHAGVAQHHHLDLDFGTAAADGQSILVLAGWVDWADGSTFRGVATSTEEGLVMPKLQMKDSGGAWVTVIEDMGIPAGKPKIIVVDLSGLWPSTSREIRLVTNLAVYWDEIFLGEDASPPEVLVHDLRRIEANLRFRGFSRPVIHPERLQPEVFVYADRRDVTMWNPTPGLYTRYGDVEPLLGAADDRFVIMGSGDELVQRFAAELPPPPPGWARQYLLTVDGWAKDGDANTAFSQSVEPLPFRGMAQYPYSAPDRFPDSPEHREWRTQYNTRPGLRLMRPLHEGLRGEGHPRSAAQRRADVREGARSAAEPASATPGRQDDP